MLKNITGLMLLLITGGLLSGCQQNDAGSIHELPFKALKLFPQGKSFSGFELVSHKNQPWQAEDFKGDFSVLFFGFANCPDICPTTLLDMQKIDKSLTEQNIESPRFVFISVDPDRDTPELLNDYINFFNPEFYALTGDAPNILSIASQIGVAYKVAEHQPGDLIYDVDHASALFILDEKGERIGIFTAPHDINEITHDLALLMESA
ncbi:SCO family protein [Marinicella sp. S1101]|uniref:SCO family protein n=1 Tax=Marinicella marina TaxID=2996016 RepID=UPI00226098AE|nr:SCO family protein [Marinicella marina]MCX7554436.1 SCO family protein [Marinicella marina]MDJ1140587.1 SCO family protein [Marinicella marina]